MQRCCQHAPPPPPKGPPDSFVLICKMQPRQESEPPHPPVGNPGSATDMFRTNVAIQILPSQATKSLTLTSIFWSVICIKFCTISFIFNILPSRKHSTQPMWSHMFRQSCLLQKDEARIASYYWPYKWITWHITPVRWPYLTLTSYRRFVPHSGWSYKPLQYYK